MSAGSLPPLADGEKPVGHHRPASPESERWLVVGAAGIDPVESLVRDQLATGGVTRVPDFLSAVGEVSQSPVDVVVGPLGAVRGMEKPTAEALRAFVPAARLILLAGETDQGEADAALSAGFDGWVPAPPTRDQLARAAAGEARPAPASSDEGRSAAGRAASLRRRAEAMDQPTDRFGRLIAPEAEDGAASSASAGPSVAPPEAAELGDTDLIESILGGRSTRGLALDILRARTGWTGATVVAQAEDVPPDHVTERLAFRGREFGYLSTPAPADAQLVAGWGAWLAHWLAMDEQVRVLKDMSMRDPLTGVWNRRYFDRFLDRILDWASRERSQVTLLVFDIDDFKLYNDRYGHAAGDEILREASRLMLSVVREHDVVARIGGDEFAVIFWDADPRNPRNPGGAGGQHPQDVLKAARRFQQAICQHSFPKLFNEAPGTLTISGGLASFPWDGRTPADLLHQADEMALQSKRQGKNAIKFGPGVERMCRPSDEGTA